MPFDPVAVAHTVPNAAAFEVASLRWFEREIGFDAAFFFCKASMPTAIALDPRELARGLVPSSPYERELEPVKRAALSGRGVAVDTAVLGASVVREQSYYRDFAAPVSGRHSLLGYLRLRGGVIGALMLGRSGGAFKSADVSLVESLLPALAVARASFGAVAPPDLRRPFPSPEPSRGLFGSLIARLRPAPLARIDLGASAIVVRDRDGYREMVASRDDAEMIWSRARLRDPSQSGWPYIDLFHLAAARARSRERALFIGCGGAVVLRQFACVYPGIAIDLVENEPAVVDLARAWYGLDRIPNVTVHADDGASFVAKSARERWDIVIVDAYDATALADGLAARSFFAGVRSVLRPGGAIAFNVIGTLAGAGPVADVVRAMSKELDDVRMVPVIEVGEALASSSRRNVVVVGVREFTAEKSEKR